MTVNVMVPPHKIADFEELGLQMQIRTKLKIEDIQEYGTNKIEELFNYSFKIHFS